MTTLNLRHPEPLCFGVTIDGERREYTVPLPTRDQMRRAMALETALEADPDDRAVCDRVHAEQLAIFAEGTELPVGQLTSEVEAQILGAIISAHHGLDPADAAALIALAQKSGKALAEMLALGSGNLTRAHSTSPQS